MFCANGSTVAPAGRSSVFCVKNRNTITSTGITSAFEMNGNTTASAERTSVFNVSGSTI